MLSIRVIFLHSDHSFIGTAGWRAFAEPLISRIDPTLKSTGVANNEQSLIIEPEIITLNPNRIIVTAQELSEALRRTASLLSSHPNPGLSKRLLDRVLLPLWSLSSWPVDTPEELEEWRAPAGYLLQILLQLSVGGTSLLTIIDNFLFQGNRDSGVCWSYKASIGGIQIELAMNKSQHPLSDLDAKVSTFIELIRPSKETDQVPELFLALCKRWLSVSEQPTKLQVLYTSPEGRDVHNTEERLINIKILQRMMDELPERLVGNSNQVLELAHDVLRRVVERGADSDTDDTTAIALSLLNIVFTSGSPKGFKKDMEMHTSVKASLDVLAKRLDSENATTAQNLLFLLNFQASEPENTQVSTPDKSIEDRQTYNLALSYLTSTESPPPVRAQGVDLLSSLIDANSPILDIPATLVLLSSLLQDNEEYIYLRVIKSFVLLSTKHPKAVIRDIQERYLDANEEQTLDTRLRLGESLLQVVEHSGSSFSGDLAYHVSGSLLFIAGRRGHRPKSETRQEKKAAANRSKNQEAEDAWNGPVPLLEENTVDDELLNQIVEGWESKRGQEDIRIRASALSIFGVAIETNISGMGSSRISEAVDMSINILALETEHEKAILRRAAILLVMSLLRALDKAREEGKKLGFGFAGQSLDDVLRVLMYIQETDNDGLVMQHAKDVIEGLNTWQMKSLSIPYDIGQTQLDELAGLSISPLNDGRGVARPRIEEIE